MTELIHPPPQTEVPKGQGCVSPLRLGSLRQNGVFPIKVDLNWISFSSITGDSCTIYIIGIFRLSWRIGGGREQLPNKASS